MSRSKSPVTRDDIRNRREAVTITEAADYLGVSHKTLRRLIAAGKLPAYRVAGSAIRIMAADVEAIKIPVRAS